MPDSAPAKRTPFVKKVSKKVDYTEKVANLEVQRMRLSELKAHPRNSEIRKHPKPGSPAWETLKKSMSHDYFDPIVWNEKNGFLVSGHLRLKILIAEDYTEVDVVVKSYTEKVHMARMLAANKTVGDNDRDGMKAFFEELVLDDSEFDLALTGFDADAMKGFNFMEEEEQEKTPDKAGKEEKKDGSSTDAYESPNRQNPP